MRREDTLILMLRAELSHTLKLAFPYEIRVTLWWHVLIALLVTNWKGRARLKTLERDLNLRVLIEHLLPTHNPIVVFAIELALQHRSESLITARFIGTSRCQVLIIDF